MHDNPPLDLALDAVFTAPTAHIVGRIKAWISRANPCCLLHPHGFFVLPLVMRRGEEWRFHLWPPGPRTQRGLPATIHTHNCRVHSRILLGELTNTIYSVREDPSGGDPLYLVEYKGDRYDGSTVNALTFSGRHVRADASSRQLVRAGQAYIVARNIYHEATVPTHLATASIVCMSDRNDHPVAVVGRHGHPETIKFERIKRPGLELLPFL